MPKSYTVEKDFDNSRFDRWFKLKVLNIPQSLIEKIIRQNKVFKVFSRDVKGHKCFMATIWASSC